MTFKKITLSAVALATVVSLSSCGGGWSEETKKSSKEFCTTMMEISYPDDAATICECYIEKLVAKYPKADFTPEQNTAIMDECSEPAKKKAEEEANRKLQESIDAMNASIDSMSTEGAK